MAQSFVVTTSTPWGKADHATRYTRGITFYSTPGHGGIKLSKALNHLVPYDFQRESFGSLGLKGWYEEDCDVAIVIVFFPQYFTVEQVGAAHEGLSKYLPEAYARCLAGCTQTIVR